MSPDFPAKVNAHYKDDKLAQKINAVNSYVAAINAADLPDQIGNEIQDKIGELLECYVGSSVIHRPRDGAW
jgi:hypothetical protein